MKTVKSIVTKLTALIMAAGLCMGLVPTTTYAASTDSVSVSGTYNYSMANSVLTEVNKQRASVGASSLTLDKTLTNEAMKRAAELSVYYSHTRPNGSVWSSAYSTLANASSAENIAAGQTSADAVMNSWMNSSGHKKNILNKDYKSIGIGSFTNNGFTYWVQVFSSKSGTSLNKSGSTDATISVSVNSSYISGYLTLTPASKSVEKGETTEITAYLMNKGLSSNYYKTKVNASCLNWSSESTSVATVNSTGTVTGKEAGNAKITAETSAGGASASTTITVNDSGSSAGSSSNKNSVESGNSSSNGASNNSGNGSGSNSSNSASNNVNNSSSNGSGNSSGNVSGNNSGKSSSDSSTGDTGNSSSSADNSSNNSSSSNPSGNTASTSDSKSSDESSSNAVTKISSCTITLSETDFTYDGTAKQPTVTVKDGSSTLKAGTDYTVSYKDNTNVGTASVVITGKGNYTGSVTKTFTISKAAETKKTTDIANCNVTVCNVCYTYDGTEKKPDVIVRDGSTTLESGTDYTLSYQDNVEVGSGKVIITGKGNYTGSVTKSFAIKRAASTSSQSTTSKNKDSSTNQASSSAETTITAPDVPKITGVTSPSAGAIEVHWDKVSDVSGYVLTYSTNEKFYSSTSYDTKAFDVFTKDSVSYTSSKLRKGETYYVKIRAYKTVDGKRYNSAESDVVSVKIAE